MSRASLKELSDDHSGPNNRRPSMIHRPNRLYEFGTFRLVPAERLLMRGNKPVALTPKVLIFSRCC